MIVKKFQRFKMMDLQSRGGSSLVVGPSYNENIEPAIECLDGDRSWIDL